ncbi:Uu.00g115690.m01.CDS01 [Anthostomella pinea]|uniref:Uu.00g115690.m01.CDS01 n=1 Tax=Anthostomella pinea TaxID=933095 RepID=A0AAI8VFX7_9PEZI|nr:Uu.00g115690.m01.CDS01 [Anthostomella pinea]
MRREVVWSKLIIKKGPPTGRVLGDSRLEAPSNQLVLIREDLVTAHNGRDDAIGVVVLPYNLGGHGVVVQPGLQAPGAGAVIVRLTTVSMCALSKREVLPRE